MNSDEYYDSPFSQCNQNCDYYEPKQFKEKCGKSNETISYFHLNIRSLSAHWENLRELLCELHGETFSFDVLGFSEVFNCDRDKRLSLPGFHDLITRNRNDDNRGGVGLFIKDNINFKIREDLSVFISHIFE